MFKRSQHVGQCCFYGNTLGSLGLIFTQSSAIMALDEYRRWKTRKCIAFAFVLCHLENTPCHINKNRELKQRGRECQRECYKTILIDLITEYNHFTWECNHLVHRSCTITGEQKKCWHMLEKKFDRFQTGRNICQHRATLASMVYKRTQHVLPNMLAQHVAFVCTGLKEEMFHRIQPYF